MDTLDTLGYGRPLEIGVPAPDFTLTMVETDRPVSLADYRGKTSLLLGLYRGVYCAFWSHFRFLYDNVNVVCNTN